MASAVFEIDGEVFLEAVERLDEVPVGGISRLEADGRAGDTAMTVRADGTDEGIRALGRILGTEPSVLGLTICESCLARVGDDVVHGDFDGLTVAAAICQECLLGNRRERALTRAHDWVERQLSASGDDSAPGGS